MTAVGARCANARGPALSPAVITGHVTSDASKAGQYDGFRCWSRDLRRPPSKPPKAWRVAAGSRGSRFTSTPSTKL
jgi:hypothetical protein